MNLDNFRQLDQQRLEMTVGGFWKLLAFAFPFIMESMAKTAASFKVITSDSGYLKMQGLETKWDSFDPAKIKSEPAAKQIVYAY